MRTLIFVTSTKSSYSDTSRNSGVTADLRRQKKKKDKNEGRGKKSKKESEGEGKGKKRRRRRIGHSNLLRCSVGKTKQKLW